MRCKLKSWLTILLVCVLLLSLAACADSGNAELPLEQFRNGQGEFQFDTLTWGASKEDAAAAPPYKLTELSIGKDAEWQYVSETLFELEGRTAPMRLTFTEADGLLAVDFDFKTGDIDQTWFDAQAERFQQVFGTETEHVRRESPDGAMHNDAYRWDGESTSLMLILLFRDGHTPTCTVHLVNTARNVP